MADGQFTLLYMFSCHSSPFSHATNRYTSIYQNQMNPCLSNFLHHACNWDNDRELEYPHNCSSLSTAKIKVVEVFHLNSTLKSFRADCILICLKIRVYFNYVIYQYYFDGLFNSITPCVRIYSSYLNCCTFIKKQ